MIYVLIDKDKVIYGVEYHYVLMLNTLIEELKKNPKGQFHIVKLKKRSELENG